MEKNVSDRDYFVDQQHLLKLILLILISLNP